MAGWGHSKGKSKMAAINTGYVMIKNNCFTFSTIIKCNASFPCHFVRIIHLAYMLFCDQGQMSRWNQLNMTCISLFHHNKFDFVHFLSCASFSFCLYSGIFFNKWPCQRPFWFWPFCDLSSPWNLVKINYNLKVCMYPKAKKSFCSKLVLSQFFIDQTIWPSLSDRFRSHPRNFASLATSLQWSRGLSFVRSFTP